MTLDVPDLPDDAFVMEGKVFRMSGENTGAGRLTPCYDEPIYDESLLRGTGLAAASVGSPLQPGRYRLDLPARDPGEVWLRIEPW